MRRRVLGVGAILAAGAFARRRADRRPARARPRSGRSSASRPRGRAATSPRCTASSRRPSASASAAAPSPRAYQRALDTATATRRHDRQARHATATPIACPCACDTRIWGAVRGTCACRSAEEGVDWSHDLVFPGPAPRREAHAHDPPAAARRRSSRATRRRSRAARTASSPARDGRDSIVGLARADPGRAPRRPRSALGVPSDAPVGVSGLERVFDVRLIGRPGGELRAGGRLIAPRRAGPRAAPCAPRSRPRSRARPSPRSARAWAASSRWTRAPAGCSPHRGSASPASSRRARRSRSSRVTGALEAGLTSPSRAYPVETKATLEGVDLANANGEACGGTLVQSFAESCNSVFAPLGAKLGARRLVERRRALRLQPRPEIPGAAMSTIPPAEEIGDDLAVGSSAIGQGRVQATALQMAIVAATIGLRGTAAAPDARLRRGRGASRRRRAPRAARTARTVERLMLAVVRGGTGTAAALPNVAVAGKTGTAELKTTTRCTPDPANPEACPPQPPDDPTRHRRLVLRLRAGRQRPSAGRGRRPARRRGSGRRHGRAGRARGPRGRAEATSRP